MTPAKLRRTLDVDVKANTRGLIPGTTRAMLAQRENEPPPAPPVPGQIDPGIRQAVKCLQEHGIETYESCEGSAGHSYPEPTVAFYGGPSAGWRAVGICLDHKLPVLSLRRVWDVLDVNEPTGPHWEITFRKRMP
jgi:hypothetical protein